LTTPDYVNHLLFSASAFKQAPYFPHGVDVLGY